MSNCSNLLFHPCLMCCFGIVAQLYCGVDISELNLSRCQQKALHLFGQIHTDCNLFLLKNNIKPNKNRSIYLKC